MTESDKPADAVPHSASLATAIAVLRTDVPVRAAWRDALLQELSAEPRPLADEQLRDESATSIPARSSVFTRQFAIRPITALAACLLTMLIGAAGTLAFSNAVLVQPSAKTASVPRASMQDASMQDASMLDASMQQASQVGASLQQPATNSAAANGFPATVGDMNGNRGKRHIIRFALVAPGASHVSLVGDFNNWDAKATPLKTTRDGSTWLIDLPLSAGRHVYAFMVDGDIVADPSAPRVVDHDFGVQNSVVLVGSL